MLPEPIVKLRADYSLMVQILLHEEVFTMESLQECLDLDGGQYVKRPLS